jgi:hypothetical protein
MGAEGENLTFAVVSGSFQLGGQQWHAGDFAMVPACLDLQGRQIAGSSPHAVWLEVRVP